MNNYEINEETMAVISTAKGKRRLLKNITNIKLTAMRMK